MASETRRWDTDRRGQGVADGGWIIDDVRQLLAALEEPHWIAEDPHAHLLPHLQSACDAAGTPWTLQGAGIEAGVYIVSLGWSHSSGRLGQLRADAVALLGSIAESVTYVRQRVLDDTVRYDAVTGMLAGDSPFRGHGHLVQLRISGVAVSAICAGTRAATP